MTMIDRTIRRVSLVVCAIACTAGAATLLAQGSGTSDATKTSSVVNVPKVSSLKSAADAANAVRALFHAHLYPDARALVEALPPKWRQEPRVRFWYVAATGRSSEYPKAMSLVADIDSTARDPWLLGARALAVGVNASLSTSAARSSTALARAARARAPQEPDLAWLAAYLAGRQGSNGAISTPARADDAIPVLAFIDSLPPALRGTVPMRLLRTAELNKSTFTPGKPADPAKRAIVVDSFAAIAASDSSNGVAQYWFGSQLAQSKPAEALRQLERAIALNPRAPDFRSNYWRTLDMQRGLPVAERRAQIAKDRVGFLAATDSAAWALDAALSMMRSPPVDPDVPKLEAAVLARAPRSVFAERVLVRRAGSWLDSLYEVRADSLRPNARADADRYRARYRDEAERYLYRDWMADSLGVAQFAFSLLYDVRNDSTWPVEKLQRLVHLLDTLPTSSSRAAISATAGRALADRRVDLPFAERLVRNEAKQNIAWFDEFPGFTFESIGDRADAEDRAKASGHGDLAAVYFAGGRYTEADTQLTAALELNKKDLNLYRDLGRLREAQGRIDDAEIAYAQGMNFRSRDANPNRTALERIYLAKHGSMLGWSEYVAALERKEKDTRRHRIVGKQEKEAVVHPGFSLPDLNGRLVSSDSLRGKFLVVNFWGTWCGPCVAEMPELQQFADRYKNDPSVQVITISNDKELGDLKKWVAEHRLTLPVLFDDGYVKDKAQVTTFPTTWFIDQSGKVQFKAVGNAGLLVEEWGWMLEAMRAMIRTP